MSADAILHVNEWARARNRRSQTELDSLRRDDIQPLVNAGRPLRVAEYAALVGTSDQIAGKRLVALVADGYAVRSRARAVGGAELYAPVPVESAA